MRRSDAIILDPNAVELARRGRLLTVGELVRRSGTSVKLVWRARTGRPVSVPKARAIAKALSVSLRSLLAESVADRHKRGNSPARGGELAGLAAQVGLKGHGAAE